MQFIIVFLSMLTLCSSVSYSYAAIESSFGKQYNRYKKVTLSKFQPNESLRVTWTQKVKPGKMPQKGKSR